MESFFFVPATKLHKLEEINHLGADNIIIDLEDAVKYDELERLTKLLTADESLCEYFVRVPLINPLTNIVDLSIINTLIKGGYQKFVLPKLRSATDFLSINKLMDFHPHSIILLIENPAILLECNSLLDTHSSSFYGLALGSHDYISEVGGTYCLQNLESARHMILMLARKAGVKAIDIASMEIGDMVSFSNELMDGFNKGFDAKFLIHPKQLEVLNQTVFYTQKQNEWAAKIMQALASQGDRENFSPVIIDGEIIERPHLNRAQKIIAYFNKRVKC